MLKYPWRLRHSIKWSLIILGLLIVGLTGANQAVLAESIVIDLSGEPGWTVNNLSMKDCTNSSTGLLPLTDKGRNVYRGLPGGLYIGGNDVPEKHLQIGLAASQEIQPLDQQGLPDASGKVVLLSVGMSNAKREFAAFMKLARGQTDPEVVLVNGAQTGYDAPRVADPNSDYWTKLDSGLHKRNISPLQVQVIWIKEAVANETGTFPQNAQDLQSYLRDIVLIIESRYPNVKSIYFSSRVYGGYATSGSPCPEPGAYEGGFAVQWLIDSQIDESDGDLAYDNTPWLAWGPYLWADGMNPRSDGLTWSCTDFENDGTHPSASGSFKVANMLLDFFNTDATTQQWFPSD